jgi:hypothetical protein
MMISKSYMEKLPTFTHKTVAQQSDEMKVGGKALFLWLYSPSWEEYSYMGINNVKSRGGRELGEFIYSWAAKSLGL